MKMGQSVPKRRHINFRPRGITQKKAYNILFLFIRICVQRVVLKAQFLKLFFAQIVRIFDTLAFVRMTMARPKSREE
jgi:hypothetical protein